jgi:hypothetical protein
MRYCKRCLYPENHPLGITFDHKGLCSGCLVHEEKYNIDWDKKEIEKITRRFAQELIKRDLISPSQNVPAPDIGTSSTEMAWIADEYRKIKPTDINSSACVTGKPANKNGLEGREEATGRGVQYIVREFFRNEELLKLIKFTPLMEDKTFITFKSSSLRKNSLTIY